MSRDGLAGLIRSRLASIDGSLHERSWLPSHIEDSFNDVLDAVPDPEQRVLVCRLAAAAIGAGSRESQHQLSKNEILGSGTKLGESAASM